MIDDSQDLKDKLDIKSDVFTSCGANGPCTLPDSLLKNRKTAFCDLRHKPLQLFADVT